MNILFISIAWPSQRERNLYSDLMQEFTCEGHNVYVIAISENKEENDYNLVNENSVTVLRVKSGKIRKTSYLQKSLSLLMLGSKIDRAIKKNLNGIKFDLLITHTPPITLSLQFTRIKRRYNSQFYLLLKDIWPQGSVDLNALRKYSLPWIYLRLHEIHIYKTADYIGCMSPKGVEYILDKNSFLSVEKVEVCPNSIRPTVDLHKDSQTEIRKRYGIPQNACVFIFSGNLGKGHGLGFLVEAIKSLSAYEKAFFLIGGSGTHYRYLEESFKAYLGGNVLLYSRLPIEEFNCLMNTSDVGLILLDKSYSVPQFPSRLLTYLDHSKPVLCAVNPGTDIGKIIEANNCGMSSIHGDLDTFIKFIMYLSENREERMTMGRNGRALLERDYTVRCSYSIIMNHFNAG